jgi:hypothetical protein
LICWFRNEKYIHWSSVKEFSCLYAIDFETKISLKFLSGFHYNRDLLKSSVASTHVETVGNRADSLHLAIKKVPNSKIYWEYLEKVLQMLWIVLLKKRSFKVFMIDMYEECLKRYNNT